MSSQLRADTDQMRATVQALQQGSQALQESYERARQAMNAMQNSGWSGQNRIMAEDYWQTLETRFAPSFETIVDIAQRLLRTAEAYEEAAQAFGESNGVAPFCVGPEVHEQFWRYQGQTNDCALYAQGGILEEMGYEFNIDIYKEIGQEEGWYSPGSGTNPDAVGRLLELYGVPVTYYDGMYGDRGPQATLEDLEREISEGHGVIVAVDTSPIWGQPGGHALRVIGFERDDDTGEIIKVICNDSGHPDGQGITYDIEDFQEGWERFDSYMVATQDPVVPSADRETPSEVLEIVDD